jgi:hypothetical protein
MARQNDALANFGSTTNEELSVSTGASTPTGLSDECSPAFLLIQNVGTTPVFYRLANFASGAGACSTTNYTGILAACTADEDGTGGVISFAGYTGGISFVVASGTGKVNVSHSGRLGD